MILKNLNYPLDFKFKITTLASDFNITDRNGNYVAYVRQKMFKLKEDVIVFNDESKTQKPLPKERKTGQVHNDRCTRMFTAALCNIVNN